MKEDKVSIYKAIRSFERIRSKISRSVHQGILFACAVIGAVGIRAR